MWGGERERESESEERLPLEGGIIWSVCMCRYFIELYICNEKDWDN